MKIIISHDIDHITVSEHLFRDAIIPKYMARMHIEVLSGKISLREYILRWSDFIKNKWQNIDELITFNNIHGVPSSFFMAVSKGIGLSYSNEVALTWMKQIQSRNCELGIHGIAYNDRTEIEKERDLFKELSGEADFGIRMHYVRNTENTFKMLDEIGYKYDSTFHAFKDPYKIGTMWEFPIQIMDGWVIENGKRWQTSSLKKSKEITLKLLDKGIENKLNFMSIDFHDRYFSHSFQTWLDWYMWLVVYLKQNKFEFVSYKEAVSLLEKTP